MISDTTSGSGNDPDAGRANMGVEVPGALRELPRRSLRAASVLLLAAAIPFLSISAVMFTSWSPIDGWQASDAYTVLSRSAKGSVTSSWMVWLVVCGSASLLAMFWGGRIKLDRQRGRLLRLGLFLYWFTVVGMTQIWGHLSFGLYSAGRPEVEPRVLGPIWLSGVLAAPVWLIWQLVAVGKSQRERRERAAGRGGGAQSAH